MITLLLATLLATNSVQRTESPAHITADSTYYDRREGLVVFKGHVHVDDVDYQLHADRAYLFLAETNSLSRIAAMGSVALTNGTKRAYGEKVTYHRENGLIVLHGNAQKPAIVADRDDHGQDRILRGRKIRFWVNQEQVEILEADFTAPREGLKNVEGLKGLSL